MKRVVLILTVTLIGSDLGVPLAVVKPASMFSVVRPDLMNGSPRITRPAEYRRNGRVVRWVFAPVLWADEWIRPGTWTLVLTPHQTPSPRPTTCSGTDFEGEPAPTRIRSAPGP